MKYCSVPVEMYFPLGPKSRMLLTGEEVPMAISGQDSVEFCRPQPQYSDFIESINSFIQKVLFTVSQNVII